MGSQTSTTRQHAFNDTYRSGIPGIGPLQTGEAASDEIGLNYAASASHGGVIGDGSFSTSPRADLQLYGRGPGDTRQHSDDDGLIPCVFTWIHGGHVVYLTGSFNNWSVENKFRLNRSGHEFSFIYNLRRGVHYYKFIVDDQWRYAPDQQTQTDERGNINNVLDITGFKHLQFKTVSEAQQARAASYHQCVPEPSEYASDAPPIPTLLTKCAVSAVEPPPRPCFPVHCLANHLFHDSHAPHIFGPQISCVASTQRWRVENHKQSGGQRYATYIYLTVNPLYPLPSAGDAAEEAAAAAAAAAAAVSPGSAAALNPLRNFLVLPEGAASPTDSSSSSSSNSSSNSNSNSNSSNCGCCTQATECPAASVGSQATDSSSSKRADDFSLSPGTPEEDGRNNTPTAAAAAAAARNDPAAAAAADAAAAAASSS